jgi:hypothetical protein
MSVEARHQTVTVAAGTPAATPQVTAITLPPRRVVSVHWRIPPGPMGSLGWRLTMGGAQVLPTVGSDQWLIASGESGRWDLADLPDSGKWQVTAYNTGSFQHSIYLTFMLDVLTGLPGRDGLWDDLALSEYSTQPG